jgi:hypothetical protein
MSFAAPNTYKRFTREEDRLIYRRRKHGLQWRGIAKELGRTPHAVRVRYAVLSQWIEEAHGDVLERHREEELKLLDKILGGAE